MFASVGGGLACGLTIGRRHGPFWGMGGGIVSGIILWAIVSAGFLLYVDLF